MPHYAEYQGIHYDDPSLQAEFDRLVQAVAAAEQARAPIQEQHRMAEGAPDRGPAGEAEFRALDRKFIAANNSIAAAKKQVDAFLGRYKNYKVQ